MAQLTHRVDLNKSEFPLISIEKGRTVLIPSFKTAQSGEDANPPQILYMHNVMPTKNGYKSVGFEKLLDPIDPADYTGFNYTLLMRTTTGNTVRIAVTDSSNDNVFVPVYGLAEWDQIIGTTYAINSRLDVKKMDINGVTYLHASTGNNLLSFNGSSFSLHLISGVGSSVIGANPIISICGSNGYGIYASYNAVIWSSTIDHLDVAPSATTGAGGGILADAKGDIICLVQLDTGFLIICEGNIISATYTGNKQYPFKFKEVTGAISNTGAGHAFLQKQASYERLSDTLYTYTPAGIQEVTLKSARLVLPEVADFLARDTWEDFDEVSNSFTYTTDTDHKPVVSIAHLHNRYVVISYGRYPSTGYFYGGDLVYNYALIYDKLLKKIGKVKIDHSECFEREFTRKDGISFLQKDGTLYSMTVNDEEQDDLGVILFGKYQYVRNRHLILHGVEVEKVNSADTFNLLDFYTLDGINYQTPITGSESISTNLRKYKFLRSAVNHSFLLKGKFNLTTMQIKFASGGKYQ